MSKYEIAFAPEAWDKWWTYCNLMPGEVGCLGYVTLDKDKQIAYVDDLFLVPQEASAAEVDFIKDGLPFAVEKAVADDRLDDLRFCIHSHGEIGTMWSGTDENMIATMGKSCDWFVSCVTNRKGSMRGRIDVFRFDPLGECHIKFDELRMYRDSAPGLREQAEADLKKYVSEPAPVTKGFGYQLGGPTTSVKSSAKKPGTPFRSAENGKVVWKWWNGNKLVILKDEGNDVFSYPDGGLTMYIDDEGNELGFAGTEDDRPASQVTNLGGGWGQMGGDVVVLLPDGEPIEDKFGCIVTDEDLMNWEVESLLDPEQMRTWGAYLKDRQAEVEKKGVQA